MARRPVWIKGGKVQAKKKRDAVTDLKRLVIVYQRSLLICIAERGLLGLQEQSSIGEWGIGQHSKAL